jgi:hypothetical protein
VLPSARGEPEPRIISPNSSSRENRRGRALGRRIDKDLLGLRIGQNFIGRKLCNLGVYVRYGTVQTKYLYMQ